MHYYDGNYNNCKLGIYSENLIHTEQMTVTVTSLWIQLHLNNILHPVRKTTRVYWNCLCSL